MSVPNAIVPATTRSPGGGALPGPPGHAGRISAPRARRRSRDEDERLQSSQGARQDAAWAGEPEAIADQAAAYDALAGGFEIASMQVGFDTISHEMAEHSTRLFAEHVEARVAKAA